MAGLGSVSTRKLFPEPCARREWLPPEPPWTPLPKCRLLTLLDTVCSRPAALNPTTLALRCAIFSLLLAAWGA